MLFIVFFCAKQDYFANKSDNSCRIISLHTHFFGNKIVVLFVVNRIIPTAKLMEDLSSKALLNLSRPYIGCEGSGLGETPNISYSVQSHFFARHR